MPSIDWYLDQARQRCAIPSDNELSRRIGRAKQAVNQWRSKKAWPEDGAMMTIAELAGVDPATALLDLNSWRCKSPIAREQYLRLAGELAAKVSAAIVACVLLGSAAVPAPAVAGTNVERINREFPNNIHYALIRLAHEVFRYLFPARRMRQRCCPNAGAAA